MTTTTQTIRSLQGRYRPAVRRAWETVCASCHTDPADRDAYDLWYRQRLREFAGIDTTAHATPEQMETLIEAFTAMAGDRSQKSEARRQHLPPSESCLLTPDSCSPPSESCLLTPDSCPPAFSPKQHDAFARLVAKAWRKVQDVDPSVNFEAWFNARMNNAANPIPGFGGNLFDRVMCVFGVIAGDEFWMQRTAEAAERRMRHCIRAKLAELGHLTQRALDWSYVQGINDQAKMAPSLDDCPAETLRSLLHMLGSAIARERRKGR
jgi:hypothetical protein